MSSELRAEIMQALRESRDSAMHYTMAARIPECGEFGGIAQNLDYVLQEIEAGRAWQDRAPMELTDSEWWSLFMAMFDTHWSCDKTAASTKALANAARQWLKQREAGNG